MSIDVEERIKKQLHPANTYSHIQLSCSMLFNFKEKPPCRVERARRRDQADVKYDAFKPHVEKKT